MLVVSGIPTIKVKSINIKWSKRRAARLDTNRHRNTSIVDDMIYHT